MTRKGKFLRNALILTAGSLILRFMNIGFRSYIAQAIGTDGMGMYQLIFSLFMLASALCTSGAGFAVTRLAAEGKGSRSDHRQMLCHRPYRESFCCSNLPHRSGTHGHISSGQPPVCPFPAFSGAWASFYGCLFLPERLVPGTGQLLSARWGGNHRATSDHRGLYGVASAFPFHGGLYAGFLHWGMRLLFRGGNRLAILPPEGKAGGENRSCQGNSSDRRTRHLRFLYSQRSEQCGKPAHSQRVAPPWGRFRRGSFQLRACAGDGDAPPLLPCFLCRFPLHSSCSRTARPLPKRIMALSGARRIEPCG